MVLRLAAVVIVLAGSLGSAGASGAGSEATPLFGVAYSHFAVNDCKLTNTGIVREYASAEVRTLVRLQLAAMRARGLEALRLIVWHMTDPRGARWGIVSSAGGKLAEPYRTNLIAYVDDVRRAGFESLIVEFAPMWTNNPFPQRRPDGDWVNRYERAKFEENWSFVRDVRGLVKQWGPPVTRIDPIVEGAPSDYLRTVYGGQIRRYVAEMYRRYVDAFGKDDFVMTFIGPPERGGDPLRAVHGGRLQNMIDIFESTGRGQPKVFAIDLPSWRYKKGDTLFALRNSDRVLTRNGLSQPLMVVETFYDDPEAAREVARFRAESTRPVPEVLQWPRRRDRRCTPGFGISPPYQADAYVKAVTGRAPSMTLKSRVGGPKTTLQTPQGQAVSGLLAGDYTIAVGDTSRQDGFRLVGPNVNHRTSLGFKGRATWDVRLGPGTYAYWSRRRPAERFSFVVLQDSAKRTAASR